MSEHTQRAMNERQPQTKTGQRLSSESLRTVDTEGGVHTITGTSLDDILAIEDEASGNGRAFTVLDETVCRNCRHARRSHRYDGAERCRRRPCDCPGWLSPDETYRRLVEAML